ncbi:MAG: gamma-glutamyl-gamma-aminobutyrate hydrolase family protein [Nostoc sp. ZfuVER08]|jgi:putative glutamine amidotransferase|uniref:Gamma-glutamyl-gamma-aminobutyrate hydrolase family protein n=1 Tax=Nostoc punctiforme FACHB-252 TaxID=1357509 RepID=A0ABR8HAM8_NOSPU|nr:gamma-glutamyl-gamma-aminobutyrate hydrolase family protein [Nostoc punctiforme]MBD2612346.1 gamma-glutamyl-gamma-aminobutyrate hydrolase family protein [Nostoc punctiforme FACHB-252]MDZ8013151.1 gamma-glutamyl-gamma-aminobutyrate hydrolase family protein [Nostoc sp. ZfuVER08]
MSRKSRKALIGITTYGRQATLPFSVSSEYIDAVRAAGGIPILLPPGEMEPATLLDCLDGLIISGGGDINPVCYNGFAHPSIYAVDSERDAFELQLAKFALERHLPILGICRGLQILMVTCGGTLIPHIPDVYGTSPLHRLEPEPGRRLPTEHLVKIDVESCLANCLQNSHLSVVSWHHQAVDKVPSGWRVVGHALDDGVIEAVEHEDHPWAIGVQWHPELSTLDPSNQRLFQALVQAARMEGNRE